MTLAEPTIAGAAAQAGFDTVIVDLQHGEATLADAAPMFEAIFRNGAVPGARVTHNEPGGIGRALDAGAMVIIVPMVNTADDARAAVGACRYAPQGTRSYGPYAAGSRYSGYTPTAANEAVSVLCMIETAQAIMNLDEILAVPGVDGTYIGPADLSITLGLPPATNHSAEPFQEALAAVRAACATHGVASGIHAPTVGLGPARFAEGFQFVTVTTDLNVVGEGFAHHMGLARAATKNV
jgi:4-hydroxy-2-oxoheptanedioate aldolase